MYYTDRFPQLQATPDSATFAAVRAGASASSLTAAVHGLVYGDVFRAVPGLNAVVRDRGAALDARWREAMATPDVSLRDWAEDVRRGTRPAHVFNTTIAETGGLLMIGPFGAPDAGGPAVAFQTFRGLYPDLDVEVATAARLSATFPVVSPQARPSLVDAEQDDAYHLADGGYFDNNGLLGVLLALDEAYGVHSAALPGRVLLVQIRAFEKGHTAADPSGGWKYALAGPLLTVFNMRSAAQESRGAYEEDLLRRLLGEQHGVAVDTATFRLGRDDAPLSWHLTEANRRSIACAWNDQDRSYEQVREALGSAGRPFADIALPDCAE
jgi:hypothetical protein